MTSGIEAKYTFTQLQLESARIRYGFALIERVADDTHRLASVFPEAAEDLTLLRSRLKQALGLLRDIAHANSGEPDKH